ncbi:MAG: hypothetical protein ACYC77_04250 [Coriobacteriia bacterium]
MRILTRGAVAVVLTLALVGCSANGSDGPDASTEVTGAVKGHGVAVDVSVTSEMLATKPTALVLETPELAVRSYLDWISYAYRIGDSDVANLAMGASEEVRINSYVQLNLQEHNRLIDQQLESIEFAAPISKDASTTIIPAKEKWVYSWVSSQDAGKVIGGPFTASYDTTYTVVRKSGTEWVVESVEATRLDSDT